MLSIKKLLTKILNKIGNTSMGTTADTITGAIAEHQQDISDLNSKITNQNVASKIHITSSKGAISGFSAMRTGNVISIAFILTLNQNVSANSDLGCTATFDDSALKPIARSIGGASIKNVDTINIDPIASGAALNANARDALGSGLAFWLLYTYICEG